MKICVLSSGSKGNSSLIITDKTKVLIDDGMQLPYIEDSLKELNMTVNDLDGILITHEHDDHIKGLRKLISKYDPLLYVDTKLYEVLNKSLKDFRYELYDDNLLIGDLKINVMKMSHDSVICNGFIIKENKKELVYITDTGYINRKYIELTSNKDMYVIESNHDEEMLENGPYPYFLKQRVISDRGHLSNMQTSKYLKKVIGDKTKKIIFIHLSETNNTPEKVVETFNKYNEFNNDKIIISKQNEPTEVIEV
jgi:phosphoribosyl 1,2-cyclic phosphodiesterase